MRSCTFTTKYPESVAGLLFNQKIFRDKPFVLRFRFGDRGNILKCYFKMGIGCGEDDRGEARDLWERLFVVAGFGVRPEICNSGLTRKKHASFEILVILKYLDSS